MNKKTFEGSITIEHEGIIYYVSDLFYTIWEDDSFEFVFIPNYFVIDLLPTNVFQGIPGLNLDERKEKYFRKNIIPTFISERVPQKNREDFYELLDEVGMNYLNPIEYLLKTKKQYSGDPLKLSEKNHKSLVNINEIAAKNNIFGLTKIILDNLAKGNDVIYEGSIIDNTNRKTFFNVFHGLYVKSLKAKETSRNAGIERAKQSGKYKGRKPVQVDMILFFESLNDISNGLISVSEACKRLNISVDKFYRVKKSIRTKQGNKIL